MKQDNIVEYLEAELKKADKNVGKCLDRYEDALAIQLHIIKLLDEAKNNG